MKTRTEIFWVVSSKHKTYNYVMEDTFAYRKKDAIRKAIVYLYGNRRSDYSIQRMNQTIQKTWKEMRINNSYSTQKISVTTKHNV